MTTITSNGLTVLIKKETVRSRMYAAAIQTKMGKVLATLVDEIGIDENVIISGLVQFAEIGVRIELMDGEFDFAIPLHNDTPEEIAVKFHKFIDSQQAEVIDEIANAIQKMDRVQNQELAPPISKTTEDKKKV